ncbi:hypothetical protein H257_16245 [Aphanomyces astaci]|uniref:Uncharacterized protein n=1 Tax=Aphanomyces astaci TaxID=112090 RepID=W4FJK6_APHAT|nr:hypothetical protein H257_16245 [Aphanomyces astaci]ETV67655.1 hypothetical protein H257_16245 [Aphanomyces astaci]|eukprot:XP_009842912.1 hypothetical protein H257_16245 [Aphanomyces astaci]
MAAVDIESQQLLLHTETTIAAFDIPNNGGAADDAETEEAEEDLDDDDDDNSVSHVASASLGKRLHDATASSTASDGKRLRPNDPESVIDLGEDDEDDEEDDDDDDDDDDVDSSAVRPYAKNGSKQFMSKGNRSMGQFDDSEPASQQHSNLQRLLDSMDRKTKTELFSDALELCGNDLFTGHEAWQDQLLLKACRLHPAFVSSINELAHQSGSYNTPVVLSGDEDDEDEEDDADDYDDDASFAQDNGDDNGDDNDDDDALNLVEDDEDDELELGDLSDL